MWKRLIVLSSVAALCLACAVTRRGLVEERGKVPGAPGPAASIPTWDYVLSAPAMQVPSAPLGVVLPSPAAVERAAASCAPECHSQFARGAEGESEEDEAAERHGREEFAFYQRSYPASGLPDGAIKDGRLHFTAQRAQMAPSAVAALAAWAPVGPSPIIGERHGAESLRQNCSGRATAVLVDPRNSNTVYVGAAQGGVWKTTNAGASWAPLTATAPSQATGFMTFDPTNPDIVYVGTGEPHGSDSHYGAGLLKSTNGGASWTVLGANVFSGRAISAVVVNPQNTQQLWVGVSTRVGGMVDVKPGLAKPGVYRSSDGGASWPDNQAIRLCSQSNPENCVNVSSVSMERGNPNVVYVGFDGYGVYKTTDGGANWSAILGPAAQGGWDPSLGDAARVEVIVAPSDSRVVYAGFHTIRQQGVSGVLFRSANSGQNWTALNVQPTGYPEAISYCGGQCSYDNVLAVHPTDPNVLAAGGAALYSNGLWDGTIFITRDGGTSFSTHTGTALDQTAHPDLHGITFDPSNPNTIWIANDGGVYRSTNGGNSWTERNGNLSTLQFQSIAQHPTDPNVMFGGMQDNAKAKTTDGGATWIGLDAGDGGFAAIDPFDTRYWFGTRYSIKGQAMQFQRNDLNGSAPAEDWPVKIMDASSGVDLNDNVLFYAPLVLDPNTAGRAYWATARLYRTDNRGDNFTAISPDLTKASSRFSAISAVSVRKGDSNTIVVGTGDGKVQVTRNGGGSWTDHHEGAAAQPLRRRRLRLRLVGLLRGLLRVRGQHPRDAGARLQDDRRRGDLDRHLADRPDGRPARPAGQRAGRRPRPGRGALRRDRPGRVPHPERRRDVGAVQRGDAAARDLRPRPDALPGRDAAAGRGDARPQHLPRHARRRRGGRRGRDRADDPDRAGRGDRGHELQLHHGRRELHERRRRPVPVRLGRRDDLGLADADSGAGRTGRGGGGLVRRLDWRRGRLLHVDRRERDGRGRGRAGARERRADRVGRVRERAAVLVLLPGTAGRARAERGAGRGAGRDRSRPRPAPGPRSARGLAARSRERARRAGAAWTGALPRPGDCAAQGRLRPGGGRHLRAGAGAGAGPAGPAGLRAGGRDEDRLGRGDRRLPRPDRPGRRAALRRGAAGGAGPARRAAAVRRPVRGADRGRSGRPSLRRRARAGACAGAGLRRAEPRADPARRRRCRRAAARGGRGADGRPVPSDGRRPGSGRARAPPRCGRSLRRAGMDHDPHRQLRGVGGPVADR